VVHVGIKKTTTETQRQRGTEIVTLRFEQKTKELQEVGDDSRSPKLPDQARNA
jgi:hypothetical protein